MTNERIGHVAGEHVRFIRGHDGALKKRSRLTSDLWTIDDRGHGTPCWIWRGKPQGKGGYCRVKFQGHVHLAHRAMHEQEIGPIPPGHDVDHLCSQRDCVNPAHLEAVTRAENVRRSRATKLTASDVAFIRGSSLSEQAAATLYGVSRRTIGEVRRGRTWRM